MKRLLHMVVTLMLTTIIIQSEIDSLVQPEMANCFFCLDGIASVGESRWVSISVFYPPPGNANTHLIFSALAASYSKSLARAPPAFLST